MAGRPTDYRVKYDDEIIVLASKEMTMYEIAVKWNTTVESLSKWKSKNKSFAEAYTRARNIQISLFMQNMRDNMSNKDYNSKMCGLYLKTALKISENRTMSVDTSGSTLAEVAINIIKSLKDDKITANEFTKLMSGISTAVKIDEVTDLRIEINELKDELDKRVK